MLHMSRGKLLFLGIALLAGLWLGYASNRAFAGGGFGAMGGIGGLILTGLIVVVLIVFAVLSAFQNDRQGGPAARSSMLGAGLVVAGFGGGWVGAVALAPLQPVQLEAAGTMRLSLTGLEGYVRRDDTPAACRSEVGSQRLVWADANVGGKVGADTVTASLRMDRSAGEALPVIAVAITPAIKRPGAAPSWSGSAQMVEGAVGDPTGRATFAALGLDPDETGSRPVGWPIELSGELAWTCDEWQR